MTDDQIIQGDCLEVLRSMPDKCFNLLLTDPPYGIKITRQRNHYGSSPQTSRQASGESWDDCPPSREYFREMLRVSKNQIIFGANYFWDQFPPTKCFVVWDKRGSLPAVPFADMEMAWTSFDRMPKKYTVINHGFIKDDKGPVFHPTQKPLKLFAQIIRDFSEPGQTVLDPFLGSGTTAIAARNLGRHYLGIERNEEYVKIAEQRLSQQTMF